MAYAGSAAGFSRFFFAANDALHGAVPAAVDGGPGKNNLYESAEGALRWSMSCRVTASTVPGSLFRVEGSRSYETADCRMRSPVMGRVCSGVRKGVRCMSVRTVRSPKRSRTRRARFLTASADGSRVLLTDGLVYDVDDLGEAPVDLSEGKGGFVGFVGQSEDLSTVYFVDTAVLTSEPNGRGAVAQPGGKNLYVRREGGAAVFVGDPDRRSVARVVGVGCFAVESSRAGQSRWALGGVPFESVAVDGLETTGPCHRVEVVPPRYETARVLRSIFTILVSGTLSCPSCNPTGEAPTWLVEATAEP